MNTIKKKLAELNLLYYQNGVLDIEYLSSLNDEMLSQNHLDLYCWCMYLICNYYLQKGEFDSFMVFHDKLKNVSEEKEGYPLIYFLLIDFLYKSVEASKFQDSIISIEKSMELYNILKIDDQLTLFRIKHLLGITYTVSGDNVKAYECFFEALQCKLHKSSVFLKASTYNWLGSLEVRNNNIKAGLFNYLKAEEILKKYSILTTSYISVLNQIGYQYLLLKKFEESFNALSQALNMAGNTDSITVKIITQEYLGLYYIETGEYQIAEELLLNVLKTSNVNEFAVFGFTNQNLGILYTKMNQFDKAYKYYLDSLDIMTKSNNSLPVFSLCCSITRLFLIQNNLEKAKEYIDKAEVRLKDLNDMKSKIEIYELYFTYFEAKKQYKKALQYSKQLIEMIKERNEYIRMTDIEFCEIIRQVSR